MRTIKTRLKHLVGWKLKRFAWFREEWDSWRRGYIQAFGEEPEGELEYWAVKARTAKAGAWPGPEAVLRKKTDLELREAGDYGRSTEQADQLAGMHFLHAKRLYAKGRQNGGADTMELAASSAAYEKMRRLSSALRGTKLSDGPAGIAKQIHLNAKQRIEKELKGLGEEERAKRLKEMTK